MKTQIRLGVFETNSSSVHTLTIGKKRVTDIPENVYIYFQNFGWEIDTHSDIQTKLNYIWTGIVNMLSDSNVDQLHAQLEKYIDTINRVLHNSGVKNVRIEMPSEYHNWGGNVYYYVNECIDHGYELKEFIDMIFDDDETLADFIFGVNSIIYTTNDNCADYYDDEHDWVSNDDVYVIFDKGN